MSPVTGEPSRARRGTPGCRCIQRRFEVKAELPSDRQARTPALAPALVPQLVLSCASENPCPEATLDPALWLAAHCPPRRLQALLLPPFPPLPQAGILRLPWATEGLLLPLATIGRPRGLRVLHLPPRPSHAGWAHEVCSCPARHPDPVCTGRNFRRLALTGCPPAPRPCHGGFRSPGGELAFLSSLGSLPTGPTGPTGPAGPLAGRHPLPWPCLRPWRLLQSESALRHGKNPAILVARDASVTMASSALSARRYRCRG